MAEFLQKFVPLRSCKEHEFKTYVEQDDEFYNFPITEVDIKRMPDYEKIKEEEKMPKDPLEQKIWRNIGLIALVKLSIKNL